MLAFRTAPAWRASTSVVRGAGRMSALPRHLYVSAVVRDADDGLLPRIKGELKNAMRSKDSFASTVYRSLLSEQQYAAKSGQSGNGGAMVSIVQKAVAKRQESARQFRAAKPPREDLAEKEDREASLIKAFLPEQISAQELESIVRRAIDEAKAAGSEGKKIMGDVMKQVNGQVDKARAPGALVSETVRRLLSKE